jgi:hypothetical protein
MALSIVTGAGKVVAGQVTDALGAVDGVAAFGLGVTALGAVIWLATDPVRAPGVDDAAPDDAAVTVD